MPFPHDLTSSTCHLRWTQTTIITQSTHHFPSFLYSFVTEHIVHCSFCHIARPLYFKVWHRTAYSLSHLKPGIYWSFLPRILDFANGQQWCPPLIMVGLHCSLAHHIIATASALASHHHTTQLRPLILDKALCWKLFDLWALISVVF